MGPIHTNAHRRSQLYDGHTANGIAYAIGYPIAVGTVAFCFAFGYTVTFSLARPSRTYE